MVIYHCTTRIYNTVDICITFHEVFVANVSIKLAYFYHLTMLICLFSISHSRTWRLKDVCYSLNVPAFEEPVVDEVS